MSASLCNGRLAALARAPAGVADVPKGAADGEAYNPVCGDEVRVRIAWDEAGRMRMEHTTRGCAVCRASAGLAAVAVAGKTREEALALAGTFEECLAAGDFGRMGGDFGVFDGIGAYPARVHCARLPWTALGKALGK